MKRTFKINKSFSINSDDDFRSYVHNVMKNAHGDEYNEDTTNKLVDDLIKDNPDADYGELIGRLTSGFGNKSFASHNSEYFRKRNNELIDELHDIQHKLTELDDWYKDSLDKLKSDYQKKKEKLNKKLEDWKIETDKFNKELNAYLDK